MSAVADVKTVDSVAGDRGMVVRQLGNVTVVDGGGSLTIDDGGLSLGVDDNGGSLTVDDGGLSLTVDGTVTTNQGSPVVMANAWPIVLTDPGAAAQAGTDAYPIRIKPRIAAGTSFSNVAAAVANTLLANSNVNRLMLTVFNDSTANLYLKLDIGASTTSFTVKILAGGYYELPYGAFTGPIYGCWDAANGYARVTDINP